MAGTFPITKLPTSASTRDKIINILSYRWPLTLKEIFNSLKKEYSLDISYQAAHKVVKQLLYEQILVKNQNGYSLNVEWIQKTKKYSSSLEKKYLNKESYSISDILNKEHFQLKFGTPMLMGRFLLDFLEECPNPSNEPVVFFWYHAWPLVAFSDKEIKRLNKIVKKTPYYILSAFTTPIDNISLSAFKEFGAKIIVEPERSFDPEHIVIGNHVLSFYFDFKGKLLWHKMCMKTKKFDQFNLIELIKTISEKPFKITVVGNKSQTAAQELRKQIKKGFKEIKND